MSFRARITKTLLTLSSAFKVINARIRESALYDVLKIVVLLLDDAAVLLLIILLLEFFRIEIPLPIIIIVSLGIGTLVYVIHKSVIPDFHRKPLTGPEGMIGLQGRVVKMLNPAGTVIVDGEYWKARSVDGVIANDETVEIVAIDKLTLKVRRKRD